MGKISNEAEYLAALKRVEELEELVDDNNPVMDDNAKELDTLVDMIEEYEDVHYPIGKPQPRRSRHKKTTASERSGAVAGYSSSDSLQQEAKGHLNRRSLGHLIDSAKLRKNHIMATKIELKIVNRQIRFLSSHIGWFSYQA